MLFTKAYGSVLAPDLSALDPHLPDALAARTPLTTAWRRLEQTLDDFIEGQLLAA